MPVLTFRLDFTGGKRFSVDIGGEMRIIDAMNKTVTFELPDNRGYELGITELPDERKSSFGRKLLLGLKVVLYAAANLFFADCETVEESKLKPYLLSAKIRVHMNGDTDLEYYYHESRRLKNGWTKPRLSGFGDEPSELSCTVNRENIRNVFAAVCAGASVYGLMLEVIFGAMLMCGCAYDKTEMIVISAVLMALTAALTVGVLAYRHKKLYKQFREE